MMVPVVQEGDVLVTCEPVPAIGVTHWRAPFTGGFECVIPAGTALVAAHDRVEGAEGVSFRPLLYEEMEGILVPEEDRLAEKYDGYSLVILQTDIETRMTESEK